jgi:hypothetical protein
MQTVVEKQIPPLRFAAVGMTMFLYFALDDANYPTVTLPG